MHTKLQDLDLQLKDMSEAGIAGLVKESPAQPPRLGLLACYGFCDLCVDVSGLVAAPGFDF
jgi:hypothetical protein